MPSAFSAAVSIAGAATNSSTSWLAVSIALLVMLLLWAFDGRIKNWVESKLQGNKIPQVDAGPFRRSLAGSLTHGALQAFLTLLIIWMTVITTNVDLLQPKLFVGFSDDLPFHFGRYVASIGRSLDPQGGYCPQVEVVGSIQNPSNRPAAVWYSGDVIKVWSRNPSVVYNGRTEIDGIGRAGGGYSTISPGSTLKITISAQVPRIVCQEFQEPDLSRLRRGRLTVTTAIHMKDVNGGEPLVPVVLSDLPIATGE